MWLLGGLTGSIVATGLSPPQRPRLGMTAGRLRGRPKGRPSDAVPEATDTSGDCTAMSAVWSMLHATGSGTYV